MLLEKLKLTNYRNLNGNDFVFDPLLTFIVGPNSVGKTNLLESIYLLLSGHGIKEDKQEELIGIGQNKTEIHASFSDKDDMMECRIIIEKGEIITKRYFINKVERRYFEFSKYLPPVVLFAPQLIESLTTQPSRRRSLFDQMLSASDIEYRKRLNNYNSAITKRNKLLERPQPLPTLKEELVFWNNYLSEQADYICNKRQELVDFFNTTKEVGDFIFSIEYIPNSISVSRLEETLDQQLQRKTTHIGPQRDDYRIYLKDFDVVTYGSRSQQRLALFWIILNQLNLYKDKIEKSPILLLDDIFSELDEVNGHLVVDVIKDYQTVITTNNISITKDINQKHEVINL